jgi:hypothetical protein
MTSTLRSSGQARGLAAAGWPVLAGLAAFVIGLLILASAAYLHRQAKKLVESTAHVAATQESPGTPSPGATGAEAFASQLPLLATHLDDVGLMLQLAKGQGVNVGPITYRSEVNAALPVVLRQAELHVDEEYPKVKAFIAELLRKMPHVYLEEVRVEQAATPSKVQATLKLSFAYQSGKGVKR